MNYKPVVLCIMDGYAISAKTAGNAVLAAKKPNLDRLMKTYPNRLLQASGEAVGLPEGQMGNSEVGHLNLGAGRIVYQSLTLIDAALKTGEFYQNHELNAAMSEVKKRNSKLHIMGLFSDGGVHSHLRHLIGLLHLAKDHAIKQVFFHLFLDGRDVEPTMAPTYLYTLQQEIDALGLGVIATISGRYYAMDRDKNFNRLELAYDVMSQHLGASYQDPETYIREQYEVQRQNGMVSDEYMMPAYQEGVESTIDDNDVVISANFRPDRMIQLATVFTNPDFYTNPPKLADSKNAFMAYTPKKILHNIYFVGMMKYADSVKGKIAFELPGLENTLGEYLAKKNYRQLRIAETEKYAHVTFFFDGTMNYDGKEKQELRGCKRILINSPKVATYDLQPEMSAYLVKDALMAELERNEQDVVILNFANCDMVGHTANFDATVKAVEVVDACIGEIEQKVKELGGVMLILADHGNAENLIDDQGRPLTSHTTNPVPFIVTSTTVELREGEGKLGDVAPTILTMLGEVIPEEMSGNSLVKTSGR